ncbi:hypothetical protein [Nostoc sp. KVJ3]|uniref:hypothetical protein n=1 Tax=Nostoc sp. KVJ3 TaxID=457945 RepID=UPI0022390364|nr:hypothetical protein [Nostoc sp. KVJ3]
MKALFVLPQIATLVALYLFQDILSPLKLYLLKKAFYKSQNKVTAILHKQNEAGKKTKTNSFLVQP